MILKVHKENVFVMMHYVLLLEKLVMMIKTTANSATMIMIVVHIKFVMEMLDKKNVFVMMINVTV